MRQSNALLSILLILLLVAAVGGCKKQQEEVVPVAPSEPEAPPPPPPPPVREAEDDFPTEPFEEEPPISERIRDWNAQGVVETVYFAFDSSELSATAQRTLRDNATWLKAHPEVNVVIEGHCDERGTIEYNLALGQRRASSVRDYLTSLGVERGRMRLVSYGEERPVDPGHNEAAWSQNRRAAFVLEP